MNPSYVELSLTLKPSYVPKSLSSLLLDLSKIEDECYKLSGLSDYIFKHQEELTKIEALKHDLPQCKLLLMEAIETLKKEFLNIKNSMESQCGQPGLVECLPTKRKNNEMEQKEIQEIACNTTEEYQYCYCSLSYAEKQKSLIQDNFQPPNLKAIQPCKENSNMEGLLLPYKESISNSLVTSSTGKKKEVAIIDQSSRGYNQGFLNLIKTDNQTLNYHPKPLTRPIWKNNKRCWNSEIHARFVEALNMLGGTEGARKRFQCMTKLSSTSINKLYNKILYKKSGKFEE